MTLKELNTYISESSLKDALNNVRLTINYFNGSVTYTGLSKIYDIIQKEYQGWSTIKNIPDFFSGTKTFFERAMPQINHFINPSFNDARQIESTKRSIESNINNYNNKVFSFSSPETQFLLNLVQERDIYIARGAYKTIVTNANTQNDNQCAERIGEIYAYEFLNKDSIITERKNKEKQALNKLRNDYEAELAANQTNLTEHLKEANDKTNEFAQAITDLKTEKEENFDQWFEVSKEEILDFGKQQRKKYTTWVQEKQIGYEALISSSTEKIEELEKLYQEKLSLEAPVTYWDNRAVEMNKRGNSALVGLIALIVLSVIVLASFFFNAPIDALQKLLAGEAYGIKWMLTSITIISFLAYGMRSLNKLMFSSYHLARDAEERRKLTYVYLALKEQGAVDKDDRHIVLQSLFSRAETGLLKDESSPTMPTALMDKFTTK